MFGGQGCRCCLNKPPRFTSDLVRCQKSVTCLQTIVQLSVAAKTLFLAYASHRNLDGRILFLLHACPAFVCKHNFVCVFAVILTVCSSALFLR